MSKSRKQIDTVRASRAGHTFHERWAARCALQLVFPKDNLFAIVVEGLSPNESLKLSKEVDEIADLILFYGNGDTFDTCSFQQILQFKYKVAIVPVTSSYLKKTIKKFASTLRQYLESVSNEEIDKKLSFGFVTNAEFSSNLWDAIACIRSGAKPETHEAQKQLKSLQTWCKEENIEASELLPLVEFRAGTSDLPAINRDLRRTISDWSAGPGGRANTRLLALVELVREKAQIEGQDNNSIRREDVLEALECHEEQLFPADKQFIDVGDVVERTALKDVTKKIIATDTPVILHADGGVGKTVFIQNLAAHLSNSFEAVVFDCFGGGAYRSESQARHLPSVGLLQIVNELASRGFCDPLLPNDADQYGLISVTQKRLRQATETVKGQSSLQGIVLLIDAADNAQLEADHRCEQAFPRLLLDALSRNPVDGVKLILTTRTHRMDEVIGKNRVECVELQPFSQEEAHRFLVSRRENLSDVDFSTAWARSLGNARVLEYLVKNWDETIIGNGPKTAITAEELIGQRCEIIFNNLHTEGWPESDVRQFFAALSLLPPPIPLDELAKALSWSDSQVKSAAFDLAPMLELIKHGAIFRDEPTETYIKEHYANESDAQQSIAQRLFDRQDTSLYAAEALPHFLTVIGDSDRAYQLAKSEKYPTEIGSDYGRRRLKLARLHAAYSLSTRDKDLNRVLLLTMQLSQVASANAKGDQFIRSSPASATILGDNDATRRLFNDRSGWRGARDTRLIVAYCFSDDLDEARIHQSRAIDWINWYFRNDNEKKGGNNPGPEASDIAAVMFLSLLTNEFHSFNRRILNWNPSFALTVIVELLILCTQHETSNGSQILQKLVKFAVSRRCLSLVLQIGLLSNEYGLTDLQLKTVARAASALSVRYKEKFPEVSSNYELEVQGEVASAAITSIIMNSRQSAKRLLGLCSHRRPSSYDYTERSRINPIWIPVLSSCLSAWTSGVSLAYHHLMPECIDIGRKAKSIDTRFALGNFIDSLEVTNARDGRKRNSKLKKHKRFSSYERDDIVKGIDCILGLVKPIEAAILSNSSVSNNTIDEFLTILESELRPDIHGRTERSPYNVVRKVGIGFIKLLLRTSLSVENAEAERIIKIISKNRFGLSDKLGVLALISLHRNLNDISGAYAKVLTEDIRQDENVEQRGRYYRELACSLISMSLAEAREYYKQGLAQLDQMGGDDFDLIYSALCYAAEQHGGYIQPALAQRLMNLCQGIFHDEPSKFGWTLFGRAAANSIGYRAIYKLIRWNDQEVANYSYGLPQLVCYLAKMGHLDVRRASVLLTVCEDHGWYDWQVSEGLTDLLSVAMHDRHQGIFSLVAGKLAYENSYGSRESLWEGLLNCMGTFKEIGNSELREHLEGLRSSARRKHELENVTNYEGSTSDKNLQFGEKSSKQQDGEKTLATVVAGIDHASVQSLDEALQEIERSDSLRFSHRKHFFNEIMNICPYNKRLAFAEALCESTELEFDDTIDLIIKCVEAWGGSTAHLKENIRELISRFFALKGSYLFNLHVFDISRQISRLTKLCDDAKFVLMSVLETIAKEPIQLGGEEWLQIATSLCNHAHPSVALSAFEDFLASSSAQIGDEIGEGQYSIDFSGASTEGNVVANVIWHLLGDSDAFVRWSVARSIKGMLDLDLVEDVELLLDRFDLAETRGLVSDNHKFSYLNAQQWLLMGLARASLYHAEKLVSMKPRLESLSKRSDLHVVNKLHLARCLSQIEGTKSLSPTLSALWNEIETPPHGVIERKEQSENKERMRDFGFDYKFVQNKISSLARLFGISENEASDAIAEEILKRWPNTTGMSDFPGDSLYWHESERFESYRAHVQRHAFLHAATTLARSHPVVRGAYCLEEHSPWQEWLRENDVSFEDGSWLADHKDQVPIEALEDLLVKGKSNIENLVDQNELLTKIGFLQESEPTFLPLYGHWKSRDGVYVHFVSALIKHSGAIGQCKQMSTAENHEFWMPMFGSGGTIDRFSDHKLLNPLIWKPEAYPNPIGIDQSDKLAVRATMARSRLGKAICRMLGLSGDLESKHWYNGDGDLVLKNQVWGELKPDPDVRNHLSQDDGEILWAKSTALNTVLKSCSRSLVYQISFSKYNSINNYDNSPGIREIYVGLKSSGTPIRFWYAKKASKAVY